MHYKRRKPRCKSTRHGIFPHGSPSHWDILFHTRPRRRRDKSGERNILKGKDSKTCLWDTANHKPHKYYW